MNVELILIIHRFHVCAFTYFLKFICNPQTIHMAVSWSFTAICRAVNILTCLMHLFYLCCCSVALTLCNAMDCGTPGFSISWSLLKLMSIKSVMPFNHLILCCPLILLPSIFPYIRVFSNELVL